MCGSVNSKAWVRTGNSGLAHGDHELCGSSMQILLRAAAHFVANAAVATMGRPLGRPHAIFLRNVATVLTTESHETSLAALLVDEASPFSTCLTLASKTAAIWTL